MTDPRPITVMVAALGGEGGGVLTTWLVRALESHGLVVQSTSIPGVAQRTGATTYYVEVFPIPEAGLGGRRPVLSLYPAAGDIDLMVASELVEAGRAVQSGYITPDRTTLIASTHRMYAIGERSGMADARFDSDRVLAASASRSRRAMLADFATMARDGGTSLNAVLLGLISGLGILPAPVDAFEGAIRESGIAVEVNLRGFALGLDFAAGGDRELLPEPDAKRGRENPVGAVEGRARTDFPDELHEIMVEGVRRLVEFQSPRYAGLYLDRLAPVLAAELGAGGDLALTREVARLLALWMSFQDVIRVAQLKSSPERAARVLAELRASENDPVVVTEFFKPGIDELCSILPSFLARPILALAERQGWRHKAYLGMHIKSTSINGYLRLWLLTKLRSWRPRTFGYRETQAAIESWLDLIHRAVRIDPALALEVASCAELIKGYGETHRRGAESYLRVRNEVIEPALTGMIPPPQAADAIANARAAALSDPTGARLEETIAAIIVPAPARAAE